MLRARVRVLRRRLPGAGLHHLAPDPAAPVLHVLSVNLDTCIGCMACEKWCPDDYDAIRMLPFALVMKDRDAYETATFTAVLPEKKIGA